MFKRDKLSLMMALALSVAGSAGVAAPGTPWLAAGSSFTSWTLPPQALPSAPGGGMKLGLWSEYTRQALLPAFSANFGYRMEIDLGLLASHEHMFYPSFTETWEPTTSSRLFFEFDRQRIADNPLSTRFESTLLAMVPGHGGSLEQVVFAPGWSSEISDGARLDVAAVFANQSYASWGLGANVVGPNAVAQPGIAEQSAGTGVRLGFSSEVVPGIQLGAAFQSRIEMDEFQTYRGVFSEPGDFDIPASANLGLVVQAGQRSSLSLDVQRVLYSEVNAFTSAGLPDRLLSLLGDGGSPEFRWQDLTVYRLGWRYQQDENWDWAVEYSTSQQPLPTSNLLSSALASEVAERNVSVGFSRKAGKHGKLHFAASYAPSEYFLGSSSLGRPTNLGEDQLEFEVRLVWDL